MKKIIRFAKTMPSATLSLVFWGGITIFATIISKNIWILILSIPFLLGLTYVPYKVSNMNKNISEELIPIYQKNAPLLKISEITKDKLNERVKVIGTIEKIIYGISPKPTIRIKDDTGSIYVSLIVPLPEDVNVGDKVEIYGVVTKHYKFFGFMGIPKLWKPKIYGIGAKKLN
ncbi:hypothetical protein Mefer_0651 [Methanocaldococcus fervens AG86]|uniref:Nucleic acid binding OB-fold tRNA/helicase-type n=2 Tax=Methanocaldococcus TaxID=196118 RepID=C7P7D8_METFA|nr:hypothetical protein Mefer_0651 [Methanocaldococcus fervens AG86]